MDARLAAIDDEYIDVGARPGLTSIGSIRESQQWNDRTGLRRPASWNAKPSKTTEDQTNEHAKHAHEQPRTRTSEEALRAVLGPGLHSE
jgi:hypothetical protein